MDKTWILVANASMATLYECPAAVSAHSKPALAVVKEFYHPDSRKKDHDLVSDREGAYFSGTGGHGNFVENSDPHQYEATVFARELYKHLEHGRVTNQYQSLILVAGPPFLGLLRQCIDERPLKNVALHEVPKEYVDKKLHELIELLDLKKLHPR